MTYLPFSQLVGLQSMDKNFQCSHCEFETKRKCHLKDHINAKHNGEQFQCTHCDFKTSWKASLNMHINIKHDQEFACTVCDFRAASRGNLKKHVKSIHEGKIFMCKILT